MDKMTIEKAREQLGTHLRKNCGCGYGERDSQCYFVSGFIEGWKSRQEDVIKLNNSIEYWMSMSDLSQAEVDALKREIDTLESLIEHWKEQADPSCS